MSKSILSYEDCREVLDRALTAERGIKITLETEGKAKYLRHRLNIFRSTMRKKSTQIYAEGDPLHGRSPYDHLIFRVRGVEILIEPSSSKNLNIEEI